MTRTAAGGIADLPPLRETIAAHGLDARKRLGQHFLPLAVHLSKLRRAGASWRLGGR